MTLTTKNTLAFELVANKLNELKSGIGDLSTLSTTAKTSAVAAINELSATLTAASGDLSSLNTNDQTSVVAALNEVLAVANAAADIDDGAPAADKVWSSNKTAAEIASAVAALAEGQDLSDLADAIAALQAADMGLVSADAAQSFTATQQAQARANIGAGSLQDVTANTAAALANSNAIGDEAAYDPVAAMNAILTF